MDVESNNIFQSRRKGLVSGEKVSINGSRA